MASLRTRTFILDGKLVPNTKNFMTTVGSSTTATTWTTLRKFIYPGSIEIGAITAIKGVIGRTAGSGTFSARVVDGVTVIAQTTGNTNTSLAAVVDFGVVDNVPTTPKVLELQVQTSAGGTTFCDSLTFII